ncbi:MAG: UDP-galactopyranose mutase [Clostridia bacterium]|nr:UDP-galactopyranose mutase [Clostridia bacterium]
MEKIIIVGAGLSGSTVARLFAESGYDVTVIDKRESVGGNVYDYQDKNGIFVQPYGTHIFHTGNKEVFDFLSKFTEWNKYEHKALAWVRKDKLVPVPFNLNSLEKLYVKDKAERIKEVLIKEIGMDKTASILTLKNHKNHEIRDFADFVYKHIYYIYTMKQWGFKPEHLGEKFINRVPVNVSYDDRYYKDEYQFMPKLGFSAMVANILRHPHIKLKLKTDARDELFFKDGQIYFAGKPFEGKVVYTAPIDELFSYKHGVLPFRSIRSKTETFKTPSYQETAVVNYTVSAKYTKITEFSKLYSQENENTVIVKEYAKAYKKGKNQPYYPIPLKKNFKLYDKYLEETKAYENLYLLGRLAEYKHVNMDKAVLNAFGLYEKIIGVKFDINDIESVVSKN